MAASTLTRLKRQFDVEITDLLSAAGSGASGGADPGVATRLLEAVFLNAITAFEAFLEELFFKAVTGSVRTGEVRPVANLRDESTARRVIIRSSERYLTWLPIDQTIDRANAYLVDGRPFSRLAQRALLKAKLKDALRVRNAIAHRSGHAKLEFDEMVGGRFATAGAYLAAASGTLRICEAFLADLARIVNGLCAPDEAATIAILGPEDPLTSGKKVPAGTYRCLGCGALYVTSEGAALRCTVCDPSCPVCGHVPRTATFSR